MLSVPLPTGELRVRVDRARWPLERLCGFAARRNPRRGFLVVSRVLGRHLPARPSEMRASARDLAALIPADLAGPVMFLGFAETAVCLGQTVCREWRALRGREDAAFIHSTRQRIDAPELTRFEEPHSHASTHIVYRPDLPGFAAPRSLVLVDDEVSTGTTIAGGAAALVGCWPGVERIVAASLTDWSGGAWLAGLPRPAESMALLEGALAWTPDPAAIVEETAPTGSLGRLRAHRNRGRLGWIGEPIDLLDASTPGGPLRIVGTGEFTFPPFLLAEQLETAGHDVVVQATSRSPARLGGVIGHALTFADNYETGVPNYLYNAAAADGRETWVCHETPAGSVDPRLVEALGARLIGWPA